MHVEARVRHTDVMEDIAIATSPDDIAYVRDNYVDAVELASGRCTVERLLALAGTALPRASYALADRTQWFPRDWWRLCDDVGSPEHVREVFVLRYRAAARALGRDGAPDDDWAAYLAGLYGACLREVTPETIVWKERLVERLDRALADPRPDDPAWCDDARADIAALDGLERPFAACDRVRFGRPTSRDRLITGPRARYPRLA